MKKIKTLDKILLNNWRGYLVATLLVALATWLKYLSQPQIIPANVPILYIVAIVLTANFFGLGPSIFVCILSVLAYDVFFISPTMELTLDILEAPILVIFILVGVIISYLSSNLRRKNQIAAAEILSRKKAEAELTIYQEQLEELVKQRTSELEKANLDLKLEINERKRVEAEISHLASFPELNPDPVLEIGISGNIKYANPVAQIVFSELTKLESDHPFLANWQTITGKLQNSGVPSFSRDIQVGESWYDQTVIFVPSTQSYRIYGRDITRRKTAENELKQSNLQLETANRELESFSYSVSHDLRAPLRSLDGFSQAMLEDYGEKLDDQAKEWLNIIRKSSLKMAELIDDILGLSRVVRTELRVQKVDLSELAMTLVKDLQASQPDRIIDFKIAANIKSDGDANLLRIVLNNLLENAVKFTAKCKYSVIEFGTTEIDGQKYYFIKDNGAGFDMAYADKLFKAFQRLHSAGEYPGTGIGLATVQRIVQRHGGRIMATGEVGKGATFYFSLNQESNNI
jgi:K+-sensing histidine kinase KdpD